MHNQRRKDNAEYPVFCEQCESYECDRDLLENIQRNITELHKRIDAIMGMAE